MSRLTIKAEQILERLDLQNPDPRCELYYQTPFQLLVSVVLSAQTTDKMVNRVMQPLYEAEHFTPYSVLKMGQEGFLAQIRSIGLAPTKAKNVLRLSEIVAHKFAGQVPTSREELESLPGVGRKTASVILGEIFRHPTLAVDTHVYRVTQRLGLQKESAPEKAELALLKIIDPIRLPAAHHHFILLGRYICKALKPLCESCVLLDLCPSGKILQVERAKALQLKESMAQAKRSKATKILQTKPTHAKTSSTTVRKQAAKKPVR